MHVLKVLICWADCERLTNRLPDLLISLYYTFIVVDATCFSVLCYW